MQPKSASLWATLALSTGALGPVCITLLLAFLVRYRFSNTICGGHHTVSAPPAGCLPPSPQCFAAAAPLLGAAALYVCCMMSGMLQLLQCCMPDLAVCIQSCQRACPPSAFSAALAQHHQPPAPSSTAKPALLSQRSAAGMAGNSHTQPDRPAATASHQRA